MRTLDVITIFAQAPPALPDNGASIRIRLALTAVLGLIGAWIAVTGIAAKAKKQQTTESLGITGRFFIGVGLFVVAVVAVPIAERVLIWLDLLPQT